jgi:hypothetical protein
MVAGSEEVQLVAVIAVAARNGHQDHGGTGRHGNDRDPSKWWRLPLRPRLGPANLEDGRSTGADRDLHDQYFGPCGAATCPRRAP